MNFGNADWRQRRNLLNQGIPFGPMHYNISNYSTDSSIDKKIQLDDMKSFGNHDLLDRLHAIPDPLRKNLADTVISNEEKTMKNRKMSLEIDDFCYESDSCDAYSHSDFDSVKRPKSAPTGFAGLISTVFGAISGMMFHRRPKSPATQYYDCCDHDSNCDREVSPPIWQMSKNQDQNKNGRAQKQFMATNDSMNNCRAAVAHCEDKLNSVLGLLSGKSVPKPSKLRTRRPRRAFVQPGSVEDSFEDAFAQDGFVSLANEEYIEYFSLPINRSVEVCEVVSPRIKSEVGPAQDHTEIVASLPGGTEKSPEIVHKSPDPVHKIDESLEIVKNLSEITEMKSEIAESQLVVPESDNKTRETISSCEDKMARLKLLLGSRKKPVKNNVNSSDSIPESAKPEPVTERPKKPSRIIPIDKTQDKRFKNPNRLSTDKRKKCKLRKNINEDLLFAHEIDSDDISSIDNSPKFRTSLERLPISCLELDKLSETTDEMGSVEDKAYFDELKGRFHSSSTTESEDSFQIVFADSPKLSRNRRQSDCESEDSFIVFEDSPDSCYTSNDVFGDPTTEESDDTDSESDMSNSGCVEVCKMSCKLSRTISDLTEDSLYEDADSKRRNLNADEVDCAIRTVCEDIPSQEICGEVENRGLLIDAARKLRRKGQPSKTVTFSPQPPKVHVLRVWAFAARQARAGHWENHARDRERFKRRIADVDMAVAWVLKPQHRSRVMFQRIMPWRNAQKRLEAAERKKKDEEDRREEAERKKREEEETERNGIQTGDVIVDVVNDREVVDVVNDCEGTVNHQEDIVPQCADNAVPIKDSNVKKNIHHPQAMVTKHDVKTIPRKDAYCKHKYDRAGALVTQCDDSTIQKDSNVKKSLGQSVAIVPKCDVSTGNKKDSNVNKIVGQPTALVTKHDVKTIPNKRDANGKHKHDQVGDLLTQCYENTISQKDSNIKNTVVPPRDIVTKWDGNTITNNASNIIKITKSPSKGVKNTQNPNELIKTHSLHNKSVNHNSTTGKLVNLKMDLNVINEEVSGT